MAGLTAGTRLPALGLKGAARCAMRQHSPGHAGVAAGDGTLCFSRPAANRTGHFDFDGAAKCAFRRRINKANPTPGAYDVCQGALRADRRGRVTVGEVNATSNPNPAIPAAITDGLNPDQLRAVTTLTGPVLVVAGPGSGKTRVLTHRIAALVATGTPPGRIVAMTFTNKAAAEMRERLTRLLPDGTPAPWAGTFHAYCARLLRSHAATVGLTPSFTIADSDDSAKIIRRLLTGGVTGAQPDKGEVRRMQAAISAVKNRLGTYEDLDPDTARIAYAYDAELARTGRVDFDDLLLKTRLLLVEHHDVAAAITRRIDHLLVDEFQDSNPVQFDIAAALCARTRNICVVGDADQAIYAFRAADATIIDRYRAAFPETVVVQLGQNYRSSAAVVALASALIAHNPTETRAGIWTDAADGELPDVVACPDDRAEARHVVERIRALGAPADTAVLVRTNAQTRPLEEALVRAGVPYEVIGAVRFYDRAEVRDALAWLRLVTNPSDAQAFERAAGAPRRGVGAGALAAVADHARANGSNLVDALVDGVARDLFGRHHGALADLARAVGSVRDAAHRGPAAALTVVCGPVGLREFHRRDERGAERVQNLDELVRAATGFGAAQRGTAATAAFLEHVTLLGAADGPEAGGVKLLTVHASKGREFPHVFVCGVEEGLFPHERAATTADVAEERRLLYVAITRAEKTVSLSWCAQRLRFGRKVDCRASRFLAELPAGLVRSRRLPASPTRAARTPWGSGPSRPSGTSGSSRTGSPRPASGPTRTMAPARASAPRPPSPPGPRVDPADLAVGCQVHHATFGSGTVRRLNGTRVSIDFAGTERTLDLTLAPLRLV